MHTLDELTNTNLGVEVAAADTAVELLALAARSVGIVEVAGVLHGNVVTLLGLVLAVAGGDQSLGDTHVDSCACEGSGVDWGDGCWERGRKSGAREEAEGHILVGRASIRPMDPRNTQRGGAKAWGPPLDFASGWSIFWAAGESFCCTDAYTKTTDGHESPRGREDVAIVSGPVGAYHRYDYDMGRVSLLFWYVLQNDRPDAVCRRPKVMHLLFLGPSTALD
jgi:hypothetical protein